MFAKIQVIGHLGNDPEIRHLPSGTINGNFSVATNRPKYTDKNTGEVVTPPPTWFRLVAYQTGEKGLVTELIQKWLKKGQLVFCEGEPRLRKYTDAAGIEAHRVRDPPRGRRASSRCWAPATATATTGPTCRRSRATVTPAPGKGDPGIPTRRSRGFKRGLWGPIPGPPFTEEREDA